MSFFVCVCVCDDTLLVWAHYYVCQTFAKYCAFQVFKKNDLSLLFPPFCFSSSFVTLSVSLSLSVPFYKFSCTFSSTCLFLRFITRGEKNGCHGCYYCIFAGFNYWTLFCSIMDRYVKSWFVLFFIFCITEYHHPHHHHLSLFLSLEFLTGILIDFCFHRVSQDRMHWKVHLAPLIMPSRNLRRSLRTRPVTTGLIVHPSSLWRASTLCWRWQEMMRRTMWML